jgi:YesN/AraC family two-component response regulator
MTEAKKIQVLFVDDDPLILKSLLRHYYGHPTLNALAAMDAAAALRLIGATRVDIVVSDLRMPSVNGIELLMSVRRAHPAIACVLVSGFLDQANLRRAHEMAEVDAVLAKPLDDERMDRELVDAIRHRLALLMVSAAPPGMN